MIKATVAIAGVGQLLRPLLIVNVFLQRVLLPRLCLCQIAQDVVKDSNI